MTRAPETDEVRAARGERYKQVAMTVVMAGVNPDEVTLLRQAIEEVNKGKTEWSTDDVWDFWEVTWKLPMPAEPRVLGPLMQAARIRRRMRPTGEYIKSRRPECHRRPIAVYRSRASA